MVTMTERDEKGKTSRGLYSAGVHGAWKDDRAGFGGVYIIFFFFWWGFPV